MYGRPSNYAPSKDVYGAEMHSQPAYSYYPEDEIQHYYKWSSPPGIIKIMYLLIMVMCVWYICVRSFDSALGSRHHWTVYGLWHRERELQWRIHRIWLWRLADGLGLCIRKKFYRPKSSKGLYPRYGCFLLYHWYGDICNDCNKDSEFHHQKILPHCYNCQRNIWSPGLHCHHCFYYRSKSCRSGFWIGILHPNCFNMQPVLFPSTNPLGIGLRGATWIEIGLKMCAFY
uniref:Uncharacterized protein n=1 Tax=Xenopus tropicalis TaxID=8364 RepID=B1WAQ7_XENTR|nr:Unknown (protein for MGC:135247) [Xenopus tropicalis]